mgnify:FL=1
MGAVCAAFGAYMTWRNSKVQEQRTQLEIKKMELETRKLEMDIAAGSSSTGRQRGVIVEKVVAASNFLVYEVALCALATAGLTNSNMLHHTRIIGPRHVARLLWVAVPNVCLVYCRVARARCRRKWQACTSGPTAAAESDTRPRVAAQ